LILLREVVCADLRDDHMPQVAFEKSSTFLSALSSHPWAQQRARRRLILRWSLLQ
jgi:hypothetical protein